jgi:hypothetical protein
MLESYLFNDVAALASALISSADNFVGVSTSANRPMACMQWGPPQCSTILPPSNRKIAVPLISTFLPDAGTPK